MTDFSYLDELCQGYIDRGYFPSCVISIGDREKTLYRKAYGANVLPGGKPYTICLPIEKVDLFIANQDTILSHKADELINNRRSEIEIAHRSSGSRRSAGVTYYKVRQGDTLGAIARRHHCTVKQLQHWNNLKGTNIRAGRTLRIGG